MIRDTQCCISNSTGFRTGLANEMEYTALTNSTSSGKVKGPATRALIATSHTCHKMDNDDLFHHLYHPSLLQ